MIKSVSGIFEANNLSKKAFLNAFAAILDYCAKILVGFIITPLLVAGLGDFYYGAWQILLRFIGYMSPASGRPTQALKFILAKEQAQANDERKRAYVGGAIAVLALFSPLLVIPGGIVSWYIPFWIGAPEGSIWNIRLASAFLVLNLVMVTVMAVPQAVLEGENKGYKRMGLATVLVLLGGGLTWLALYLQSGIIGISIATLFYSFIQLFFYLAVARSCSSWFGVARPSREIVGEFLKLSGWFMAWNLINNLMLSADTVLMGLMISVESVTMYTLSKFVPETLITIIAMLIFGVLPGFSGIIASGDHYKAAKIRGEMMIISWLIVTVLGASILLWNRTFITLWVGPNHFIGNLANFLIVLSVIQFVLIRNDANIIDLTLNLRSKVILGSISILLSISFVCFFILVLGMNVLGAICGIIVGRLVLSVAYPHLVGRIVQVQFASQLRNVIRPGLVSLLLFSSASILDRFLATNHFESYQGWFSLIAYSGISACVILVTAFYLGLSEKQRRSVFTRVRAVIFRPS